MWHPSSSTLQMHSGVGQVADARGCNQGSYAPSRELDIVALKTWVRRGRAASDLGAQSRRAATLASPARRIHFHLERGASQPPLSRRRRRRRRSGSAGAGARGSLPPSLPSPPPPTRRPRLCLARRRAQSQRGG